MTLTFVVKKLKFSCFFSSTFFFGKNRGIFSYVGVDIAVAVFKLSLINDLDLEGQIIEIFIVFSSTFVVFFKRKVEVLLKSLWRCHSRPLTCTWIKIFLFLGVLSSYVATTNLGTRPFSRPH
jgi:hypothetical protein